MKRKTVKVLAISYAVKTALVGLAWLMIPDLPDRALGLARDTWSRVTATPASAVAAAPGAR